MTQRLRWGVFYLKNSITMV